MLESICKFMQQEDRNGDAMEMYKEFIQGELPKEVILEVCHRVINEWLEDGLELTKRIEGYMNYLNSELV
jgi:hypothetical protein